MADQADNLRQLVRAQREWRAIAPADSPAHGPVPGHEDARRALGHAGTVAGGPVHRFLGWVRRRPRRTAV